MVATGGDISLDLDSTARDEMTAIIALLNEQTFKERQDRYLAAGVTEEFFKTTENPDPERIAAFNALMRCDSADFLERGRVLKKAMPEMLKKYPVGFDDYMTRPVGPILWKALNNLFLRVQLMRYRKAAIESDFARNPVYRAKDRYDFITEFLLGEMSREDVFMTKIGWAQSDSAKA